MRRGHRFLRLHYFYGIGDTRDETITRLDQRLFRSINVAARDIDLFFGRLQVQQGSANIGVNLCA